MKIAVFSDTHDNIWKLERALGLMKNADVLIHCGDLCSPFVMKRLATSLISSSKIDCPLILKDGCNGISMLNLLIFLLQKFFFGNYFTG